MSRRTALAVGCAGLVAGAYFTLKQRAALGQIPFLITIDVHDLHNLTDVISKCLEMLANRKLNVTFFVPAAYCMKTRMMPSVLRRMCSLGHQIGCHGLYHDAREDYYTDSIELQRKNLSQAKSRLEDAVGGRITSFRAPAFRISAQTVQVLEELNFSTDLSVCSQRLPLLSSQIGNYHWLYAPRAPYHPSRNNPYARGELKLLEIPTSAIGVPFMSTISAVATRVTKLMTVALTAEASHIKKPIVYQCHPEEFVPSERGSHAMKLSWRSLLPNERYGIPARWAFLETDKEVLHERNEEMIEYFTHIPKLRFLTIDEYCRSRV